MSSFLATGYERGYYTLLLPPCLQRGVCQQRVEESRKAPHDLASASDHRCGRQSSRKGRTYGALIVDLERHQPIEMLPDKTAETFASWLKAHPTITVITRDRDSAFKEARLALCTAQPSIATARRLANELGELLRNRNGVAFDDWLEEAKASGVSELRHFALSLELDYGAVKAAFECRTATPSSRARSTA